MECEVDFNNHLLSASETPPCEGPKLRTFFYPKDKISRIESFDCSQEADAPRQGGEQPPFYLRSVSYAGEFKFFKPCMYREILSQIRGRMITDRDLAYHTDPIYADCRAYAKIQQTQQTDNLKRRDTPQCYGFLTLSAWGRDEDFLVRQGVKLWGIPLGDPYRSFIEGSPIRAIVKEYIEVETGFKVTNLRRMLQGIKYINKLGILHMDIHPLNYKAGLLVDFGSSWTKPHCIWSTIPANKVKGAEGADLQDFQDMVDSGGFGLQIRAIPRSEKLKRFRPRAARVDATLYG